MNKKDSMRAAESFTGTVADLLAIIDAAPTAGKSIVNPSLTKAVAIQILRRSLEDRPSDERPKMFQFADGSGGATHDLLKVQNIYRECA